MIRLVDGNWRKEFLDARARHPGELLVISPFMKKRAVELVLERSSEPVRAITRFNLEDFAAGASDLEALRVLLDAKAQVRGIKNLHSKLYIFGSGRAIVTSANLTNSGLAGNHEFGLAAESDEIVRACRDYFECLWCRAGENCALEKVWDWEAQVSQRLESTPKSKNRTELLDFGVDIGFIDSLDLHQLPANAKPIQAFVKFFGTGSDRATLDRPVLEVIKHEGCHRVATYPATRRPSSVEEGAIFYLGHFTREPRGAWGPKNIRVFGRAIAKRHDPDRDVATEKEKRDRKWKAYWSNYIRLSNSEFVAGTLANAVSLNELMDEDSGLGKDAFASTRRNAKSGKGNIDPRKAYMRQPAVLLSSEGITWLEEKLQETFATHGKVPVEDFQNLD